MKTAIEQLNHLHSVTRASTASPRERRPATSVSDADFVAALAVEPGRVVLGLCRVKAHCESCPPGTSPHNATHVVHALRGGMLWSRVSCWRGLEGVLEAAGVRS